jgi:hypothetical protein
VGVFVCRRNTGLLLPALVKQAFAPLVEVRCFTTPTAAKSVSDQSIPPFHSSFPTPVAGAYLLSSFLVVGGFALSIPSTANRGGRDAHSLSREPASARCCMSDKPRLYVALPVGMAILSLTSPRARAARRTPISTSKVARAYLHQHDDLCHIH